MTRDEAETLAKASLVDQDPGFELLPERTRRVCEGWLVFYQSVAYLRSGDLADMLAGNGPLLVRFDGSIEIVPSWIDPATIT